MRAGDGKEMGHIPYMGYIETRRAASRNTGGYGSLQMIVHTVYRSDGLPVRVVHTTGLTTHVFVVDPGFPASAASGGYSHESGTLSRSAFGFARATPPDPGAPRAA